MPTPGSYPEVWPESGFVTLPDEIVYYEFVDVDHNGKVTALRRCTRGVEGTPRSYPQGTPVYGCVVAQQHNQLVNAVIEIEKTIGELTSTIASTPTDFTTQTDMLGFGASLHAALSVMKGVAAANDDTCPDVILHFNSPVPVPSGTDAEFCVRIYPWNPEWSYILDFGDGSSTTTEFSGTHSFTADGTPTVTVTTDTCTIVVQASSPEDGIDITPPLPDLPDGFYMDIPDVPSFPVFSQTRKVCPGNLFNLPPMQVPYLELCSVVSMSSVSSVTSVSPCEVLVSIVNCCIPSEISIVGCCPPSIISIEGCCLPSTISVIGCSTIAFENTPPSVISFEGCCPPSVISFENCFIPSVITFENVPPSEISLVGFVVHDLISITCCDFPSVVSMTCCDFPSTISITCCEFPSIISFSDPSLPTEISLIGPSIPIPSAISFICCDIPSIISFANPDLPTMISLIGDVPSSISITCCDIPSVITFGQVEFPSSISLQVELAPFPTIISVECCDIPSAISIDGSGIPDSIGINLNVPSAISINCCDLPSVISVDCCKLPSLIVVQGPELPIPSLISFDAAPSLSAICFCEPPVFAPICFCDPPSFLPIELLAPSLSSIEFGPAPSIADICFCPVPSFEPIQFGTPPPISVAWGTPPLVSCIVTVVCGPSSSPSPMAMGDFDNDFVGDVPITVGDLGIPEQITIVPPNIPDIRVIHDLPREINVKMPTAIPDIHIIGPDKPLPEEISIVGTIPDKIHIVATEIPKTIKLDASEVPQKILVEPAPNFPSVLRMEAIGIPDALRVVGIPPTIELVGLLPSIQLVMPENPTVELVWKGAPFELGLKPEAQQLLSQIRLINPGD